MKRLSPEEEIEIDVRAAMCKATHCQKCPHQKKCPVLEKKYFLKIWEDRQILKNLITRGI